MKPASPASPDESANVSANTRLRSTPNSAAAPGSSASARHCLPKPVSWIVDNVATAASSDADLGAVERQIKAGVPRPETATKPRPITRVVAREKRLKVTPIRRASQPESRRLAADPSAGRLAVLAVVIVPGELRALVVPGVPRCGDREHAP